MDLLKSEPRQIDESEWRQDVIDLHGVMHAAHGLYVLLEHSNEAMVRVVLEICTCKSSRKVLWWQDGWWSNEEQRTKFKSLVGEKFDHMFAPFKGHFDGSAVKHETEGSPETKRLQELVDKLQAALLESELSHQDLNFRLQGANEKAESFMRRAQDAESASERFRSTLRQGGKDGEEASRLLREAEQRALDAEKRLEAMGAGEKAAGEAAGVARSKREEELSIKLAEIQKQLDSSYSEKDFKQVQQRLDESEGRVKDLTRELEQAKSRASLAEQAAEQAKVDAESASKAAAAAKGSAASAVAAKPATKAQAASKVETVEVIKADPKTLEELAALQDEVATARAALEVERHRVEELEASDKQMNASLSEAHAELAELRKRLGEAKSQADVVVVVEKKESQEPVVQKRSPQSNPVDDEALNKELADVKAQLKACNKNVAEKDSQIEELGGQVKRLEARLGKSRATVAEITEAKQEVDDKLLRALKALQTLKEQVKRLEALAERKGLGKAVRDLMEESGVQETMESKEYTIFDRLYEDAIRRQEKARKNAMMNGSVSEQSPEVLNQEPRPTLTTVGSTGAAGALGVSLRPVGNGNQPVGNQPVCNQPVGYGNQLSHGNSGRSLSHGASQSGTWHGNGMPSPVSGGSRAQQAMGQSLSSPALLRTGARRMLVEEEPDLIPQSFSSPALLRTGPRRILVQEEQYLSPAWNDESRYANSGRLENSVPEWSAVISGVGLSQAGSVSSTSMGSPTTDISRVPRGFGGGGGAFGYGSQNGYSHAAGTTPDIDPNSWNKQARPRKGLSAQASTMAHSFGLRSPAPLGGRREAMGSTMRDDGQRALHSTNALDTLMIKNQARH